MSRAAPPPPEPSSDPGGAPPGPLQRRPALVRLGHVLLWTLLFYLLTYGIAKLCEWLARG